MTTSSRIEVAVAKGAPSKDKGDLLEHIAAELLRTHSYEVEEQVRITGAEVDLLCRHRVNQRSVWVECKAYREPLGAAPLKTLLGNLEIHDYDEAWLISTGPLGKEAKGIKAAWEKKPPAQRQRLSIYTPELVIRTLIDARIVCSPPDALAAQYLGDNVQIGEWILLITTTGRFWCASCLEHGIPTKALVFDAGNGQRIDDVPTLRALAKLDSTCSALDFEFSLRKSDSNLDSISHETASAPKVVQVTHGESWDDYRPARPEHFIGRDQPQKRILGFLEAARTGNSPTRVFALTGDTGMGKSSLVAKLRNRTRNTRNRRRYFLYAVDVRAATGPSYIAASLLACLKEAAERGYGEGDPGDLVVSNSSDPLSSPSIQAYLATLANNQQVVCLVFDQFEELYSKPDLFPVFEEAQRLFLSASAANSALVIGFVLRSDSTVQQDHPAYYLWHQLSDHRYEVRLSTFSYSEICASLTLFEKELGEKLRPDLRRQIIENCEGYPWLLKKLCIHLYEQIREGSDQSSLDETMDVESLFARDLNACTPAERTCLQVIAKQSPADWYEILEVSGAEVIRSLQDKRLIVRSGDKLNLYWDVFREYVLTKKVPSIPFTYLCSSPSIGSFLSVAARLSKDHPLSVDELTRETGLSAKTIGNVVHDLVMFGIANNTPDGPLLDDRMEGADEQSVLERLRAVMKRHALILHLSHLDAGAFLSVDDIINALKEINPTATHRHNTWQIYAERLGPWFVASGLWEVANGGWIFKDAGVVRVPNKRGRFRVGCFLGDAPPLQVVQALIWLAENEPQTAEEVRAAGFRNAVRILDRLELTGRDEDGRYMTVNNICGEEDARRLVWAAAAEDETLVFIRDYLNTRPTATGTEIGDALGRHEKQAWAPASKLRIGNGLRQWAAWVEAGEGAAKIPKPPGPRVWKQASESNTPGLF